MSTLVCAINPWSCGLACVEAILADNGISKIQSTIIADLAHLFPAWKTMPGSMTPGDFENVFRGAGFPVKVVQPATFKDAIVELNDITTVGAVIWVTRFWDNPVAKGALSDLNHALRFVSADQNGAFVMNPYRCPSPAKDEYYTWLEVHSFKSGVLVFKK